MKRKILLPLSMILIVPFMSACPGKGEGPATFPHGQTWKKEYTYQLNEKYSADYELTCKEQTYTFVPEDLVTLDNKYNPRLAELGAILSAEMYDFCNFKLKVNNKFENRMFGSEIGIQNYWTYNLSAIGYTNDPNDTTYFSMGHLENEEAIPGKQVIFIMFRGTNGDSEWASDFDIGYDDEIYFKDHPGAGQWYNRKDHKGYDVTLQRITDYIEDYTKQYTIDGVEPVYFITGHSRGGAMTNVLARYMQDNNMKYNAYSFACPNVTEEDETKCSSYKNLFNIVNTEDIISDLPTKELGFNKFGKTFSFNAGEIMDKINEFYGQEKYKPCDVSGVRQFFNETFVSRSNTYAKTLIGQYVNPVDSEEAALEEKAQLIETLTEMGCIKNVEINDPVQNSEGKWIVEWKYSPAVMLDALLAIITKGALYALSYILMFPTEGAKIMSSVGTSTDMFVTPHLPSTYIAGAKTITETK